MSEEAKPASAKTKLSLGLILGVVNTVAVVAALGALVYTKLLYTRPKITEHSERERLVQAKVVEKAQAIQPGNIQLDPITVNIKPTPNKPKAADGTSTQIEGKLHYASIGINLEIRNISKQNKFDEVRPIFMDQLLSKLGRKSFDELSSVQGRYILRTEILEMANHLIKEPLLTNVFFTEFIVQ